MGVGSKLFVGIAAAAIVVAVVCEWNARTPSVSYPKG